MVQHIIQREERDEFGGKRGAVNHTDVIPVMIAFKLTANVINKRVYETDFWGNRQSLGLGSIGTSLECKWYLIGSYEVKKGDSARN